MAIQLIADDEHLTCTVFGVDFDYRRPPVERIQEIRDRHTSRGKTDEEAVAADLMESCIFNWRGPVHFGDPKEPTPFDPKLLKRLPGKVKLALAEIISEQVDGEHVRVDPT